MANGTCSYPDCDRQVRAKGWCVTHYNRVRLWGTPGGSGLKRGQTMRPVRRTTSVQQRFESKVIRSAGDCWGFRSALTPAGYHMVCHQMAHRVAYEMYIGPIPDGIFIDHICHNRACVNPEHLRLATNKQNQEHRIGPNRGSHAPYRGVEQVGRRWMGIVRHNGKPHYTRYFNTAEDANEAVTDLRNRLFTHNIADRIAVA